MREFYARSGPTSPGGCMAELALTGIAELPRWGLYIQYWFPRCPNGPPCSSRLAVVLAINLMSARAFGEFEFWAAIAKVGAIVIFPRGRVGCGDRWVQHRAPQAGFRTCGATRVVSGRPVATTPGTGRSWVMSGVCSPTRPSRWSACGREMANSTKEVPRAVNRRHLPDRPSSTAARFLLLVSDAATTEYKSGTSPFVTIFDRMACPGSVR